MPGRRSSLPLPRSWATAIKAGAAPEEVVSEAVDVMCTLNDRAASAMLAVGASAATDVTGFGLLGHLHRMLVASGVAAEVRAAEVPLMSGVRELASAGHVPGGTERNRTDLSDHVTFADAVDHSWRALGTHGAKGVGEGMEVFAPPG